MSVLAFTLRMIGTVILAALCAVAIYAALVWGVMPILKAFLYMMGTPWEAPY